jgi:ketosteroid isomerase-like protein
MDLERRVESLESERAIRDRKREYCYRIDDRDWAGLVDLFTPDASLDYGGMGEFEGHDGVREFGEEYVAEYLEATAHALQNGRIEVDGNTATGRWYVIAFVTMADGTCGIRLGEYRDRYRRDDGEWRIESLQLRFRYSADYDDGWPNLETHEAF